MPNRVRSAPAVQTAVQIGARHAVKRRKENFHGVRRSWALVRWNAVELAAIASGEHHSFVKNSALAQLLRCCNGLLGAKGHPLANSPRRRVMPAPDQRDVNSPRAGAFRV